MLMLAPLTFRFLLIFRRASSAVAANSIPLMTTGDLQFCFSSVCVSVTEFWLAVESVEVCDDKVPLNPAWERIQVQLD